MRNKLLSAFLFALVAAALTLTGVSWTAPLRAAEHGSASTSATSPGSELQHINALAGHWTVKQSFWVDPAKPPAVDHGRATFTTVLGGRHLRQELHINSAKPFDGLGYLSYNQASGKYDSLWMDVNFTGMILVHGDYAPATHTYTFRGATPDFAHPGTSIPMRQVIHVRDADHFSSEFYETHGGKEALVVRLEYARVK